MGGPYQRPPNRMPSRTLRPALAGLLLAAFAFTVSGCKGGITRPPSVNVQVVDAASALGSLDFVRQAHIESTLAFRQVSSNLVFDEDTYDFHVRTTPPGATSATEVTSFTKQVQHGTDYLFVLADDGNGGIAPITLAAPVFTSSTDAQIAVVHAAHSAAAVDAYVLAPGADPAAATPLGNVAFKGTLSPTGLTAGDYQLVLTESGNPANVLFRSPTVTLAAGSASTFVIADGANGGLTPLSVVVAGPASSVLYDQNAQSGLEVVNAASDGGARDLYLDSETTPRFAAVPSPSVTQTIQIPPGDHSANVTPAGNPGASEVQGAFTASQGATETLLIAGDPGSLAVVGSTNDKRTIANDARLRFINAAGLFTYLDFYLVQPGTDVTTVVPQSELTPPSIGAWLDMAPGTYDLVVRDPTTSTIVAGPQSVTLTQGLFTILVTNGASGTANVVQLQGFN